MPAFLKYLTATLGRIVTESDVLPQDVSDSLRTKIHEELRSGFNRPFPSNHLSFCREDLAKFQISFRNLATTLGSEVLALHLSHFDEYPLVLVNAKEIADRVDMPWLFGDDVTICTADGKHGLCGTYNEGDFEEAFEIVSWS